MNEKKFSLSIILLDSELRAKSMICICKLVHHECNQVLENPCHEDKELNFNILWSGPLSEQGKYGSFSTI